MEILLIRHGQSEGDILHVHEGRADFPLTKLGVEQAQKMARRVKVEFQPEYIWSSPLQRASKTATILADKINCPIKFLPELQEIDNGKLARRPVDEGPHLRDLLPHQKLGGDGESKVEIRTRAEYVLSFINQNSIHFKRIAIVSHGVMIKNLLDSFLNLPVTNDLWFATGDTAIHFIEYTKIGRRISFTNNDSHLLNNE